MAASDACPWNRASVSWRPARVGYTAIIRLSAKGRKERRTPPTATVGPPPPSELPFQLFSPATGTVTDFGDAASAREPGKQGPGSSFNRIVRETRGGTLDRVCRPDLAEARNPGAHLLGPQCHSYRSSCSASWRLTSARRSVSSTGRGGRWEGVVTTPPTRWSRTAATPIRPAWSSRGGWPDLSADLCRFRARREHVHACPPRSRSCRPRRCLPARSSATQESLTVP